MKVIRSLETRGMLLEETTRKMTDQEREFLIFLRPLMSAGLPLMKTALALLAKSILQQQMQLFGRKRLDPAQQY